MRLGAVGYALAPAVVIDHGKPSGLVRFVDALRGDVTDRILKALPRAEGVVVSLTGEQSAVDKDIAQAMRDLGLAHILSISGLHIVFVVGLVMDHPLRHRAPRCRHSALRVDAKKIAAVFALAAALFYTALPARRCRPSAPAPWRPLHCSPSCSTAPRCRSGSSLGPPSFALIAAPEVADRRLVPDVLFRGHCLDGAGWRRCLHDRAERRRHRWLWRVLVALGASLATTLIASVATGAFAAYHFNRLSLLGVVAAEPRAADRILQWACSPCC